MRTFLSLALVATGLAFSTPEASATSVDSPAAAAHGTHYDVYYRSSPHSRWCFYGSFDCVHSARNAAHRFEHRGYDAYYRAHR